MLWLRRLVDGSCPRSPWFDPMSAHVGFVVDKVSLGASFSPRFSLSISFQQCSILAFIYMLLLAEGQNTDVREVSKKQYYIGNRCKMQSKILSLSLLHINIISAPYGVWCYGCVVRFQSCRMRNMLFHCSLVQRPVINIWVQVMYLC